MRRQQHEVTASKPIMIGFCLAFIDEIHCPRRVRWDTPNGYFVQQRGEIVFFQDLIPNGTLYAGVAYGMVPAFEMPVKKGTSCE